MNRFHWGVFYGFLSNIFSKLYILFPHPHTHLKRADSTVDDDDDDDIPYCVMLAQVEIYIYQLPFLTAQCNAMVYIQPKPRPPHLGANEVVP